jgi:hypothetical protein
MVWDSQRSLCQVRRIGGSAGSDNDLIANSTCLNGEGLDSRLPSEDRLSVTHQTGAKNKEMTMPTSHERLRWLLLGAIPAALVLASVAGAGHDPTTPYNPAGVMHLNVDNDENPDGTTRRTCSPSIPSNCFEVENDNGGALVGRGGVGVRGESSSVFGGNGVLGMLIPSAPTQAGPGIPPTAGVRGINLGPFGDNYGVLGSTSGTGAGVYGTSPQGWGVHGRQTDSGGSGPGTAGGVYGDTGSTSVGAAGIWGQAYAETGKTIGTVGVSSSANGIGLAGAGSIGIAASGDQAAAHLVGDAVVTGTLTKGAGAFRIDHPLDPGNKYLQHSFVESPDMKNVYDGIVRTDKRGFAVVGLPRYFSALNRALRYQLTLVGRAGFGEQAVVWEKMAGNRFTIRTTKPRLEVSWQITGIRKDRFANANRIKPEVSKRAFERGLYQNPELYGPAARSVIRLPKLVDKRRSASGR